MTISGTTTVTGLLGYPVSHSLSPAMHNAAFVHLGLDFCYVPFPVRPGEAAGAVHAIRTLTLRGVNVTVPHKEKVMPLVDILTPEAYDIGAVNTIVNEDGRLTGHNTDAAGFMKALEEARIDVRGRKVLILGAGGAARAVAYPLCRHGSSLYLYNRTDDRAESLRSHLGAFSMKVEVVPRTLVGDRRFLTGIDVVVNTTPLGLDAADPLPINPSLLDGRQTVCDLIYRETPLLREASKAGCRTMDGLGMLLWQGVYAFELWTGAPAPVEVMRAAVLAAREERGR